MANAQQQCDVIYDYDSQGRIIVNRYAKGLDILDGDKKDKWEYKPVVVDDVPVNYANLLGDVQLDVQGAQPVKELSPNVTYNVYLDLNLADNATGFSHPVWFEFTDQYDVQKKFSYQLKKGDNMVPFGQFNATLGCSPSVSFLMYDNATRTKKGLLVRRMMITTA